MTETAPAPSASPKPALSERVRRWRPSNVTGGVSTFPLLMLFGFNLVDELDREAYSVLLPDIRDSFGLSTQGILVIASIVGILVQFLEIPIALYADRGKRTRVAIGGAAAWSGFSVLTGLAPNVATLVVGRVAGTLGRAVNGPTHRPLLADYYPIENRPAVFAFHSAANSIGQFLAPVTAGLLAVWLGWRAPFLIFAVPTFVLIVLSLRLREPVRGIQERRAMGASAETAETEEAPASFSESWRILWGIKGLRRVWIATPIIGIPLFAVSPLLNLWYADVLGLNAAQRGLIATVVEPFQFVGLFLGIPIASYLLRKDPSLLAKFFGGLLVTYAVTLAVMVFAESVPVVVVCRVVLGMAFSLVGPSTALIFSLILPPRVRSIGYTMGNVFQIPIFLVGPVVGGAAERIGLGPAIITIIGPLMIAAGVVIWTAGNFIGADINKVRTSTLAMAEVRRLRLAGKSKLLLVKNLDVSYTGVQVLFDVDFEVDEGEIVALLGTNGAGKSTLLKAISGLVENDAGAIVFDGADITYAPANEVVAKGVVQVPGGKGVFPGLSVAENLRIAGWIYRRESDYLESATERVLEYFPVLRRRWDQPAGDLSGGEQQMLTLGMAFIAKPRLLMIDELSLGLAPIIVEQLLEIVKAIRERGTTIILVEQSVNIALTVAETAFFMEKGEIMFHGRTADLLERPDILRSVFLEGAATAGGANGSSPKGIGRSRRVEPLQDPERSSTTPLLEAVDLRKSYGGVAALNGVSFQLHEGEILGVIGPNGAGKTTLFDLVSGFVLPDSGRLTFDGHDITTAGADRRARLGLGRSFQDARLFPALTVAQCVSLALERHVNVRDPIAAALNLPHVRDSERDVRERVEELIELMGLGAFRDKFVSELSTGSRRIVDMACVVAHDPKVLLFDEPSSGIAQRETEALGPLLLRIRETTGASLLVIEHDMPLITSIADEIIALDLGTFVTQGRPEDVVNHPHVVASYLGNAEEVIARSGARGPVTKPARRARRAARANRSSET